MNLIKLMAIGILLSLGLGLGINHCATKVDDEITEEDKSDINEDDNASTPKLSVVALDPKENDEKVSILTLGAKNTLVLRGPVMDESVAKLQKKILSMSNKLSSSDVIYLVIDSPGGSIDAGNTLLDTIKALPQKVKTVTLFSASMAFHIVQNLDERLITTNGTLMSHRASLGGMGGEISGDARGELITRLNWILRTLTVMDHRVCKRIGMKFKDYEEMIANEYWVSGADAIEDKMADRQVLVKCGDDLVADTEKMDIDTFFGVVHLEFSKCPVITAPLSVKFDGKKSKEALEFIRKLTQDKRAFVRDYIVTGEYLKVIR